MTPPDDLDSEMFTLPWQTRPDVRATEGLLSGSCAPQEVPAELRPVADVLSALREPPVQREFTRWDEALAAYRGTVRPPADGGEAQTRPLPAPLVRMWPTRVRFRLAIASGIAMAGLLGGGVAAAYTGSLPASLQKFAHDTIAAPAASATMAAKHAGRKVGPSASARDAQGLCNAYEHATQHGDSAERSVAFRNLVAAAGGEGKVAAYCAPYRHPGRAPRHGRHVGQGGTPAHTSGHHGKPPAGSGSGRSGHRDGNGKGNGNGNGDGNGNGNGDGNGNGNGAGGGKHHVTGHGEQTRRQTM